LRPQPRRSRPWQILLQGLLALGLAVLLARLIVTAADGLAMLWAPAVLALVGVGRMAQVLAWALGALWRGRLQEPQQPQQQPASSLPDSYRYACAALGVAPGSSWEEVRAAWRRQLPHWHPDRGGDLELWHQRQSAYRLLAELRR
jgi:hypothetical protein